MSKDSENSKAQIATPGPCCNHETSNSDDKVSETGSPVNVSGWVVPDSFWNALHHPADSEGERGIGSAGYGAAMAAFEYLDHGKSVFPCNPNGKEPCINDGFKGATRDAEHARAFWTKFPCARIGIPTGIENKFFVLDVDQAKNGGTSGFDSLAVREAEYGKLPDTYTVKTPSGGMHLYFKMPNAEVKSSAGRIGVGLDIRAGGGYIIAAGSSGYTVLSGRFGHFAEAPKWLVQMVRGEHAPVTSAPAGGGDHCLRM